MLISQIFGIHKVYFLFCTCVGLCETTQKQWLSLIVFSREDNLVKNRFFFFFVLFKYRSLGLYWGTNSIKYLNNYLWNKYFCNEVPKHVPFVRVVDFINRMCNISRIMWRSEQWNFWKWSFCGREHIEWPVKKHLKLYSPNGNK